MLYLTDFYTRMNHIWDRRDRYFPLILPGSPVHTITWSSGVEEGVNFRHAESCTGVLIFAAPCMAWVYYNIPDTQSIIVHRLPQTTIFPAEIQESVLAPISQPQLPTSVTYWDYKDLPREAQGGMDIWGALVKPPHAGYELTPPAYAPEHPNNIPLNDLSNLSVAAHQEPHTNYRGLAPTPPPSSVDME